MISLWEPHDSKKDGHSQLESQGMIHCKTANSNSDRYSLPLLSFVSLVRTEWDVSTMTPKQAMMEQALECDMFADPRFAGSRLKDPQNM